MCLRPSICGLPSPTPPPPPTTTTTTGAWKLSSNEVKLEEKLASGAYGEVWKGALHDRWIVAIKKLFHHSSSSRPKSSSVSKHSSASHKKSHRNSTGKYFKDDEIRFLMRKSDNRAFSHVFLGYAIDRNARTQVHVMNVL